MQVKAVIFWGIFYLFIIVLTGCLYQSLGTIPDNIKIFLSNNSKSKHIIVKFGSCDESYIDTVKIFNIKLDHLQGGRLKLLGIITISEQDPNEIKRIIIADSTSQIRDFTVNEIMQMDTIMCKDLVVYKINL